MRKIKNEFMTHWDGLMTKPGERILVLAATCRPFDLDEAIIRRFERRIMVGLPSTESREKNLRTLLSKEKTDNLDFHELGQMTEGYSGSDLKSLCITAAYRPVRELIQQERLKDQERKKREEAGTASGPTSTSFLDMSGLLLCLQECSALGYELVNSARSNKSLYGQVDEMQSKMEKGAQGFDLV